MDRLPDDTWRRARDPELQASLPDPGKILLFRDRPSADCCDPSRSVPGGRTACQEVALSKLGVLPALLFGSDRARANSPLADALAVCL